ncbi:hypothetical protein Aeh1ORF115c [Aeromonas phage Aeh1]|uniref:Uncharacterized protein n=1 Tax=Aeromonas phage Aeh1 TaxID=2880362 RepID=Q76YW9_9CAUD|nr:hypothetical protein Aeh1p122 [Aeromonas phage Aeh1]AAQ17777.1 hypothetical protein Aeh1ORF115c [Aeromonas phage Aeh1]
MQIDIMEVYKRLKERQMSADYQLECIRAIEIEKQAQTVNGKLSRDGVKLLNRLDDLYMHRMNVVVPEVAQAKRDFYNAACAEMEMKIIKGRSNES